MLRTTVTTIANVVVMFAIGGCVEGFQGASVQIDLRNRTINPQSQAVTGFEFPVQAGFGATPGPNELPQNSYFTLYGIPDLTAPAANLVELKRFEVHRVVDLASPCFIDVGDNAPFPGLHVTQYGAKVAEQHGFTGSFSLANPPPGATERQKIEVATAAQRMQNIALLARDIDPSPAYQGRVGVRAVTSASSATYPAVAASCAGPDSEIPPPSCTDSGSNQRRLRLCQAAWDADPDLFEGTDRVLITPLSGTTHGMVDGENPVNEAPVGGATFVLYDKMTSYQGFAIYNQLDGGTGLGTRIVGSAPVPGSAPTPTLPLSSPTRGVTRATMLGVVPGNTAVTVVLMAFFADVGNDSVHF